MVVSERSAASMPIEILSPLRHVCTIARGTGIRELRRLQRKYGKGRWRKRKGHATVRLDNGLLVEAEVHWYEASGIGKKEFKIKRFL